MTYKFQGENYNQDLSVKDITRILREDIKKKYPEIKVSVRKVDYSAIRVSLMQAPFEVFINDGDNIKHAPVNHYYIKEDKKITDKAKEVLSYITKLANSFNFDDSDVMTDYFHSNFYFQLEIGQWDKPFIKS